MRCGKAREWLSLETDGQLPPDRIIGLEKHMETCGQCRAYRADLSLGQRMLAATTPDLPENFDWRLRLKLNQALQKGAQEIPLPWAAPRSRAGNWFASFSTATAVGLAAVLALAVFLGPTVFESGFRSGSPFADSSPQPTTELVSDATDRLPLNSTYMPLVTPGRGLQRTVSATGFGRPVPEIIFDLQSENRYLRNRLFYCEQEIRSLKARLDTTVDNHVDETEDR